MRSRALSLLLALVGSAVAVLPAAGGSPRADASFYVVEPDPRMCPSPLCGGYWVSLANHPRTRCADGILHRRCYVARAEDAAGIHVGATHGQPLVRGRLEPGRDDLGLIVVARIFEPVGTGKAAGRYFRIADTGIRCVRAPCFTLRAAALNTSSRLTLSGLVAASAIPESLVARVERALAGKEAVFVRGRIEETDDGGRELHASRFYLRSGS